MGKNHQEQFFDVHMSSLSPSETFFVTSEMELKLDGHVHSRVQNKTSVGFLQS